MPCLKQGVSGAFECTAQPEAWAPQPRCLVLSNLNLNSKCPLPPFPSFQVRGLLDELAASIGGGHMLMQGAMRYFAQATVMAKKRG